MTLSDLIEKGRFAAERGRALAELVPYGLVALVSRFAIASVFWRSGQPTSSRRNLSYVCNSLRPTRTSSVRLAWWGPAHAH